MLILLSLFKEMKLMKIEMELQVKFSRPVDFNKDYVVPGGYEMVMNGKPVQFDFNHNNYGISRFDSSVVIFSLSGADLECFPEFEKVTIDDLQHISKIIECFVYLGEPGESDLEVVSVEKITFLLPFDEPGVIDVPSEVIAEFNKILGKEKKGIYEIKLSDPELKEKIMAQQLSFYSRFLDIPLEKLCDYDKEQIETLVDSTLMQMPEDILMEFVKEINGGKAEE